MLCTNRGYYCDICQEDEIIFPFERTIIEQCTKCNACFHSRCWRRATAQNVFESPCIVTDAKKQQCSLTINACLISWYGLKTLSVTDYHVPVKISCCSTNGKVGIYHTVGKGIVSDTSQCNVSDDC